MRTGILQFLLVALVMFQVALSEKDNSTTTTESSSEKDIIKEETGRVSYRTRPNTGSGPGGSRSVSRSKSSSKSTGNGSGDGYGYGSSTPEDKGPQGGSYGGGYRGHGGPGYSPSYEDDSKGSAEAYKGSPEAYKSSREEGSYRGGYRHRDSTPEYSTSYEDHYDNRGRYGPYQSEKGHKKSYSGSSNSNRGYSSSPGRYGKDDDLPSVSPDGFIESHSNQQTSAEKYDPQDVESQGYGGSKDSYRDHSYKGGPPLTSGHDYSGYSERDVNTGYGGPSTYGGFSPMTNVGSPKYEPYTNVIGGKGVDGNKMSLYVKQLGGAPLSQIQGKDAYEAGNGKFAPGKEQQQGYLLFPVVPKGTEGVSTQGISGYDGGSSYSGMSEGKIISGILRDAGFNVPAYGSHQQGREYAGTSGSYGLENAAYQQDKGGYGQAHKVVPEGKNIYTETSGVYSNAGGYPNQEYASVGAGRPGKSSYGESYGVAGGHGAYDNSAKYGSPVGNSKPSSHGEQYPAKSGGERYGYNTASGGGGSYKNSPARPSAGGYHSTGSLPVKDYPREYSGVVNFAGGPSSGYAGANPHGVPADNQGKSGASYESGPASGAVGYGHIPSGIAHGSPKNYPSVGYSSAQGYGDVSHQGIEQPVVNIAGRQPIAPKDKKSKSVAIFLQKQPISTPSLGPVAGFGPELDTQFKTPFKDYLGGSGFDLNLGGYSTGITDFGTGLKARGTSDLLHGFDGYSAGLSPLNYASSKTRFY